jgi:hypothetical protein
MTPPDTLRSIATRVAAATGANDWTLIADLAAALSIPEGNSGDQWEAYALLRSTDAVLALIEERLAGWLVSEVFQRRDKPGFWFAELERDAGTYLMARKGNARTLALALLAAALEALAVQAEEVADA